MPMPTQITGADRFAAASQLVVDHLNRHSQLKDWSVSRVVGGEQIHVHVHRSEILAVGMRVAWPDTFCHRMVAGAPSIVPDAQRDPEYNDLDLTAVVRAYAGVPIADDDGSVFGVLCGVGTEPVRDGEVVDPELLSLCSQLLSGQAATSRQLDHGRRSLEVAEALCDIDELTGLLNRRAWNALVAESQVRIDAYGDLVSVAVIDLDGLKTINDQHGHAEGDILLARAGAVLRASARGDDRVARYGGDEFAVLAEGIAVADLDRYYCRLGDALAESGIEASVGWALAGTGATVTECFSLADQRMYDMKRQRQRRSMQVSA